MAEKGGGLIREGVLYAGFYGNRAKWNRFYSVDSEELVLRRLIHTGYRSMPQLWSFRDGSRNPERPGPTHVLNGLQMSVFKVVLALGTIVRFR